MWSPHAAAAGLLALSLLPCLISCSPVQGPSLIGRDLLHFLDTQASRCHVPPRHLSPLLRAVGAERSATAAGYSLMQLCYRPYPGATADRLGSYCALMLDLIRAVCDERLTAVSEVEVPPRSAVSAAGVCAVVASWVRGSAAYPLSTRSVYGDGCESTCAEDAEMQRCYQLFYGKLLLTAMQRHSNNTAGSDPGAGESQSSIPSGVSHPNGMPSAGEQASTDQHGLSSGSPDNSPTAGRQSAAAPPRGSGGASADAAGSHHDQSAAQHGETQTDAEKSQVDSGKSPVDTAGSQTHLPVASQAHAVKSPADVGKPPADHDQSQADTGKSPVNSGETPALHGESPVKWDSAAAVAPPPQPPRPDAALGMKPGVVFAGSAAPKLSGYSSDGAIAAEGGSMAAASESQPDAAANKGGSGTVSGGNVDAVDTVESEQSGAAAPAGGKSSSSSSSSSVNPSAAAAPPPAASARPGASSSGAPAPDDMQAPPIIDDESEKVAAPAAGVSSARPPPNAPADGWPVLDQPQPSSVEDSAPAAPPSGDTAKLPPPQQVLPDPGALDYEDSMLETVLKPRPAQSQQPISAEDGDDVTFDRTPQLYKAPSGVRPEGELAGVSAFQPLQGQGGSGSNFFAYSLTLMVLVIVVYLVFHNKQKIMGLIIEGRSTSGRRRPHSSQYRKLDSSLEEAITSQQRQQVTSNIIY